MLAELAAANAAFAVIKQCVQNGRELTAAGNAIAQFVTAKEQLQRKGNRKRRKSSVGGSDLEEFMALEKIREQEEQLKQFMIYAGRPGLWNDWQRFQAEARKSRRVQEELAKRRREEIMALEKIREQEEQLKQFMIYAGRPGLWNDWQRFQAEARKSRRVQEELAKRRREEIMEMVGYGVAALIVIAGIVGLVAWALWMKGVF